MIRIFFAILVTQIVCVQLKAQNIVDSINLEYIDNQDLKAHIRYLASDKLKGRMTGEMGQKLAAEYIQKIFTLEHLNTWPDNSYLQAFDLNYRKYDSIYIQNENLILNNLKQIVYMDNLSIPEKIEKELVFIGDLDSNLLENIDLKDKIVAVTTDNLYKIYAYDSFLNRKNAFGIIAANPTNEKQFESINRQIGHYKFKEKHFFLDTSLLSAKERKFRNMIIQQKSSVQILITTKALADLINLSENKINSFDNTIDKNYIHTKIAIKADIQEATVKTENVIGEIKGAVYPKKYIVITAHYDHLGIKNSKINYGADDNSSGVAGMLEIIDCLRKNNLKPNYSILFLATTAEEEGLLGAKYFMATFPKKDMEIIANINLDMIGRVDKKHIDNKNYIYTVGLTRSSKLEPFFEKALLKSDIAHDNTLEKEGLFGSSDHVIFLEHDIPSIFFHSGTHPDYHTPEDIPSKVNYKLMKKRLELIFYTIWFISNGLNSDI